MIDLQTPPDQLQLISAAQAAEILGTRRSDLVYTSWPQITKQRDGTCKVITGEAWISAPEGCLNDGLSHPAVIFHKGTVLGTVDNLDGIPGYLTSKICAASEKPRATLAQITGFREKRRNADPVACEA